MLTYIDNKTKIHTLILFFWATFWLLNGGDKFFNGKFTHISNPNVTKGVLINLKGEKTHELKGMETIGWYGVNRNAKTINYFSRLNLPSWLAISLLYSLASLEVILGFLFVYLLLFEFKSTDHTLIKERLLHRLAFKLGVIIFTLFTIFDTLLGDRTELWEHSTFLILYLVTYDLWYRTDQHSREEKGLD